MQHQTVPLRELLARLAIPVEQFAEIEIAQLGVLRVSTSVPATIDTAMDLLPGTIAYTFYRRGSLRSGEVVVNGYCADGSWWEHGGRVCTSQMANLKKTYRVLSAYPLGRVGQPAKAVVLVNVRSREMFVVDRAYFENEVYPVLEETLAAWTNPSSP